MIIDFFKMSGTGNDFVVLDNRENKYKATDTMLWKKMCQRRTGIGADGVLLFNKSKNPSYDFSMSIINSDGTVGEMCANGARCLLFFAHHALKFKSSTKYTFETLNGVYSGEVLGSEVSLKMTEISDIQKIKLNGLGLNKKNFYVNTGVPHSLFEVDDLENFDVEAVGKKIRHDSRFKNGTNVSFFQILDNHEIFLRTFERGVEGETLSCGTAVTAVGVMAQKILGMKDKVIVLTAGGTLSVHFDDTLSNVYLKGLVEVVYRGNTKLEFR